jgi:hypothetical protein
MEHPPRYLQILYKKIPPVQLIITRPIIATCEVWAINIGDGADRVCAGSQHICWGNCDSALDL